HASKTKVQLSEIEYLQTHPSQFHRFIKEVWGGNSTYPISKSKGLLPTPSTPSTQNMISLNASTTNRVEPFYLSLLIKGFQLNNCIIDFGASDNVIPGKVANALGLTLTPVNDTCYSMESKQVPLVGRIKDARVALADYPDKKILLTILVVDIPASF
ncbi:hypothetical protein KI387_028257, partial [Taxus chinensis]